MHTHYILFTFYTLNAAAASDFFKDLDASFPNAATAHDTPANAEDVQSWSFPGRNWWKTGGRIHDEKNLINPLDQSVATKFEGWLARVQRLLWSPEPNITQVEPAETDSPDAGTTSNWWDKFRRQAGAQNNTQSIVNDNQIVSVRTKDAEEPSIPAVPENEPSPVNTNEETDDDDWGSSMPAQGLMKNLRCMPLVSFTACLNHCYDVLPAASEAGEDLTAALMPQPPSAKSWFSSDSFSVNLWSLKADNDTDQIEKDARAAGRKSHLKKPETVLDWAQKEQLKLCLFSVCSRDYLKAALPGCLNSFGVLVPPASKINNTEHVGPNRQDYDELNFYNPQKLAFYSDLGYFTFSRMWHNFFPQGALSGWFMLPIWLICLIVIPVLVISWANPVAGGVQSPSSSRLQDGGNSHGRLCEDLLARHPAWRWVQKTVHALGGLADMFMSLGTGFVFLLGGLFGNSALDRLLPNSSGPTSLEMAARGQNKRADGYHSLAQQEAT